MGRKGMLFFGGREGLSLFLFVFAWVIPAAVLFGQATGGSISGTVRDQSGAAVPEATITARHLATGTVRTTTSGGTGTYRLPALIPGEYEIRVERTGFRPEVATGLNLTIGQEAVFNATLQVGAVAEAISVVAEAPIIETTSGSLSGVVEEKQIQDLPLNGRNITELALLEPGVNRYQGARPGAGVNGILFSSQGAPIRSNLYLLDGTIMNDRVGGGFASAGDRTLGSEGIREFRLVTNTMSAEFGMHMGSVMQAATKSGTNEIHGSVFEFLRNDNLDARQFFDVGEPPEFKRNQFGASFGGPILRDKLFFFGSYEGVREVRGNTIRATTFTADARRDGFFRTVPQIASSVRPYLEHYPLPNVDDESSRALAPRGLGIVSHPVPDRVPEDFYQIRGDYNLNDSHNVFVRYTLVDGSQEEATPNAFPGYVTQSESRNQYVTGEYKSILSPTLLNTARVSFSRTRSANLDITPIPQSLWLFDGAPGMGQISITNGPTRLGGNPPNPNGSERNILQTNEDVFLTKGNHGLKLGAMFNRDWSGLFSSNGFKGDWSFDSPEAFLLGQATTYTRATWVNSGADRNYLFYVYAFYLQDDWRVSPRLTLNLGLRYEFMTQIREVNGIESSLRDVFNDAAYTIGPVFANPSKKNFSPRFGFAWDVFGDGTTAVRGGYALQYDLATFGSALSVSSSGSPPFVAREGLNILQVPIINFQRNFVIPAAFRLGPVLRGIEYNLQQPHLMQYNLSVQRQLPGDAALTVAYSGSRGLNLMQQKEGNPWIPQLDASGNRFWPRTAQGRRMNRNFETWDQRAAGGSSWYNALQWKLEKRLSRGISFQSSYTFSKTLDTTQGQISAENSLSGSGGNIPIDPHNISSDRGPSSFDIRHNWRFNAIWHVPFANNATGVMGAVARGWQLGTIWAIQSGGPLTVSSGSRTSNPMPAGNRPAYAPGMTSEDIVVNTRNPNQYFSNGGVFTMPVAGYLGNVGRAPLRGPGLATVDISLGKNFALPFFGEASNLQFRGELFNILNRANFLDPARAAFNNAGVSSPTLGLIDEVRTSAREIQLGLRLVF